MTQAGQLKIGLIKELEIAIQREIVVKESEYRFETLPAVYHRIGFIVFIERCVNICKVGYIQLRYVKSIQN